MDSFVTQDFEPGAIDTYADHFWVDEAPAPAGFAQCWGDQDAYASTGTYYTANGIPTTDPRDTPHSMFSGRRVMFYGGPSPTPASVAADWAARNEQPLASTVAVY